MPYLEHAARQHPPTDYIRFRRKALPGFPAGVEAIVGVRRAVDKGPRGGRTEIQSLRFDSSRWTPARARAWLRENGFTDRHFEAGKGEKMAARKKKRTTRRRATKRTTKKRTTKKRATKRVGKAAAARAAGKLSTYRWHG